MPSTSAMAPSNGSGFLTQEQQDAMLAQQLMQQDQVSGAQPAQPFVRAPDRVVTDRLVGPYVNQFGSSRYQQQRDLQQNFSKEWKKGPQTSKSGYLGKLFGDPEYRFQGDLEAAKREGQRVNKWLLINILYRPTTFPCILVLDPSTGRQDYEFAVPEEPDKVATVKTKLLEFLDDYPNPKVKPKKRAAVPSIPKATDMAPHMSHDDKLLQEALAASMADVDHGGDHGADNKETHNHFGNGNEEEMKDAVGGSMGMDVEEPMEEEAAVEEEVNLEDLLEPEPEANDP